MLNIYQAPAARNRGGAETPEDEETPSRPTPRKLPQQPPNATTSRLKPRDRPTASTPTTQEPTTLPPTSGETPLAGAKLRSEETKVKP